MHSPKAQTEFSNITRGKARKKSGMQRFFAETPGAVRYDWGNMILNMVWPLAEYGPIGLVILALHRWENRRETISDL